MPSEIAKAPRVLTKAPPWHGWVTADTFLLSLATGTFSVAALFVLLRPYQLDAVARIAFYLVFPIMLGDLVCLVADLGDPMRFHHMLRTFKPGSPMSIGVWAISIFSFIAFLAFVAAIFDAPQAIVRTIAGVGLLPALVVAAYKGVLFSGTAQPAWRRMRWLGAAFALSAPSMGAATMVAIAASVGDFGAARIARYILMWLLVLSALVVRRVMGRVSAAGHLSDLEDRRAVLRTSLNYTIFIVAGLGLPIVLCVFSRGVPSVDAATAAVVMAGALLSRQYLVMLPHQT
jgi:Polysulphide reductase, NrfD